MKRFQIESIDTVYDFFFEMFQRCGKFDPATDLTKLTNPKGQPCFNEAEGEYLEAVMMECFIFCVLNDLNIYTLATMVQCDMQGVRAAA